MTETFTASNGIEISLEPNLAGDLYLTGRRDQGDGSVEKLTMHATAGPDGIAALREFFQAEEDKRLGRWRWPENPNYVVYPSKSRSIVQVLKEVNGHGGGFERGQDEGFGGLRFETADPGYSRAARAYFDAHPERKPWHDAKEGEVWVVTRPPFVHHLVPQPSVETVRYVTSTGKFGDVTSRQMAFEINDPHITEARRIWPEDAS